MTKYVNVQISNPTTTYEVVVVGAGPYGLSTAAHLLQRRLKVAILGRPLQLWCENMPEGMLLRSHWWATNFSDSHRQYGLTQYLQETGQCAVDPLPVETLIKYGFWFKEHMVPNVDETCVKTIERKDGQFVLTLADHRVIRSLTVVMAPGLRYYVYRPTEYDHLPSELVSHSSEHHTFERFAGKSVIIIGRGQSALETAALAFESGAHVQVIARNPIVWLQDILKTRSLMEQFMKPRAGIGPGWFGWYLEHFPYAFQRLPLYIKVSILRGFGSYGPAGAAWLKPRVVGKIVLHESLDVQQVQGKDNRVILTLTNKTVLEADHLILGTGYRVNIKKLPMLHPSLNSQIQTYQNTPLLSNQFESSIPGLYFVGFSSVPSCGPLYRFVLGTDAAARRVADSIVRQVASK